MSYKTRHRGWINFNGKIIRHVNMSLDTTEFHIHYSLLTWPPFACAQRIFSFVGACVVSFDWGFSEYAWRSRCLLVPAQACQHEVTLSPIGDLLIDGKDLQRPRATLKWRQIGHRKARGRNSRDWTITYFSSQLS
jgi:hypothetical protein